MNDSLLILSTLNTFYINHKIEFNEGKHTYKCDGELFTGVTTICNVRQQEWKMWWTTKANYEYLQKNWDLAKTYTENEKEALLLEGKMAWSATSKKAKDSGSLAHDYIESYLLGQKPELPEDPEACNAIEAFLNWEKKRKPEWVAIEKIVVSLKNKVAGRFDSLCNLDGKLTLLDLKTSTQMSEDYILQQAGYLILLEEMGIKPEVAKLLRIPKIKGEEAEESPDLIADKFMDFCKETFLHLREVHRYNVFIKNNMSDDKGKFTLKPLAIAEGKK